MKTSLSWLKEYVDTQLAPRELARKLAMVGLEACDVKIIGENWDGIIIGQVALLEPHPNADRLQLVTLNFGDYQTKVVTGASNLKIGYKVPFAKVGSELLDGHSGEPVKLKPARIRGILSEGMVCSEKELGISEDHSGIMVLDPQAPVGHELNAYINDTIFNFEVTPNRPDLLSVIGIAREIAAMTGNEVKEPVVELEENGDKIENLLNVTIEDPETCLRYTAVIIDGISIKESPFWIKDRLSACGLRPINNIVDITNYVMLEYGQPIHAFDYALLRGKRIVVRRANEGEVIISLDSVERILDPNILVIADQEKPIAIAGIMGGLNSEISGNSRTIVIESANFEKGVIRRGSTKLGLKSEASLRFEKGLCQDLPVIALKRAASMILELAGGNMAKGIIDVYPIKKQRKSIQVSAFDAKRVIGVEINSEQMERILLSLGFECCLDKTSGILEVSAPYWRTDIFSKIDLVEEIARITGYDKIPQTYLSAELPKKEPQPLVNLRTSLKERMIGQGFQEILTYSLTNLELMGKISPTSKIKGPQPLQLINPMSHEQEYLRTTLRASMLSTMSRNQRHAPDGMRLFEIGKIFLPRDTDLPEERESLCASLSGYSSLPSWKSRGREIDFFYVKGIVESILEPIISEVVFNLADDDGFHPGKSALVSHMDTIFGILGEIHPKVLVNFDINAPVYLIEIDVSRLGRFGKRKTSYCQLPRFPFIIRDIALLVDDTIKYDEIRKIIKEFRHVHEVGLFDLYTGEQIPSGKKSFALRLHYLSLEKTLTEEEINSIQLEMLEELKKKTGACLRSS